MVQATGPAVSRIAASTHKRSSVPAGAHVSPDGKQFIDLSHTITQGMVTYKGLPAPLICDYLTREASRRALAEGTSFQISKIEMVASTGTYIDSPFHRFEDGCDLAELPLDGLAEMDAVVVRVTGSQSRVIDWHAFAATEIRDRAVLVHTDWAQHWGTDQYFDGHPFLTATAATYLKDKGARLVGIDSLNIDDTADGTRPVHTILLGARIPIVEHLRGLDQLPRANFTFSAVPPKVKGAGTFPVRAYATLPPHPATANSVAT